MKREEIYADLIVTLLDDGRAHRAIRFEGDKRTIVATRRFYGKKPDKRVVEILITDGPPNYENRQRLKATRKSGALKPKFILQYPPGFLKRRKNAKA